MAFSAPPTRRDVGIVLELLFPPARMIRPRRGMPAGGACIRRVPSGVLKKKDLRPGSRYTPQLSLPDERDLAALASIKSSELRS
jgi:hypothetical protein